jgi:uncharacterized protein involved in cysteine biosynthesis
MNVVLIYYCFSQMSDHFEILLDNLPNEVLILDKCYILIFHILLLVVCEKGIRDMMSVL